MSDTSKASWEKDNDDLRAAHLKLHSQNVKMRNTLQAIVFEYETLDEVDPDSWVKMVRRVLKEST